MREPRTPVGRAILDLTRKTGWVKLSTDAMQGAILAIEDEAATPPASAPAEPCTHEFPGITYTADWCPRCNPGFIEWKTAATPPASAEREA